MVVTMNITGGQIFLIVLIGVAILFVVGGCSIVCSNKDSYTPYIVHDNDDCDKCIKANNITTEKECVDNCYPDRCRSLLCEVKFPLSHCKNCVTQAKNTGNVKDCNDSCDSSGYCDTVNCKRACKATCNYYYGYED